MKDGKLPSEHIAEFLEFMSSCKGVYEENVQKVYAFDRKQQDYLHELEFADNYEERCKLGTKIHNERKCRRQCKDKVQMVEKIAKFRSDRANKQFVDRLKQLLKEQREVEEYLTGERVYKHRG